MLNRRELKLIGNCFLFRHIDEFIVEQLTSDPRCEVLSYPKGAVVYSREQFRACLGILLSGKLRVKKPGSELLISTLRAGDCFGAAAMFHHQNYYVNELIAVTDLSVLMVPQELLIWSMQREFRIAENYISYLSDRILFLNKKMEILSAGSAEEKLITYLRYYPDTNCSMTDLCLELNLGRATLYRVIEKLEGEGIIYRENKKITLIKPSVSKTDGRN